MFQVLRVWCLALLSSLLPADGARAQVLRCADLSSLDELEAGGAVYTESGAAADAMEILHAHGLNAVRLRLFHTPTDIQDALEDVLRLARRADEIGLHVVLNLHYSDTWADPGRQTKPAAWAQLSAAALEDSVYAHTHAAVTALEQQGTAPILVQVGNEITSGLLWDTGRVGGTFDTDSQWTALARLLERGIAAVRAAGSAQIMLHIDRGGDATGAQWFFDRLAPFALDFDVIGLSYYPWWHGDLADLERTSSMLQTRYNKQVVLIETAYPWTLDWNDNQHNQVGLPDHLLNGFPATPAGQANFLSALWDVVPAGLCYWAAELIAAPSFPSSWENVALFDFQGEVLPASKVLGGIPTTRAGDAEFRTEGLAVFPNPVYGSNPVLNVRRNADACTLLRIYNSLGRRLQQQAPSCGAHVQWALNNLAPGVYWLRSETHRAIPFFILP